MKHFLLICSIFTSMTLTLTTALLLSRSEVPAYSQTEIHPPASVISGLEGDNVPITFYGKVIDQNGDALSGVNVKLRVQQIKFDPRYLVVPKYIFFDRTTGSDGSFLLDGVSARGVDITSITKAGYEFEKGVNPVYGALAGTQGKPVALVLRRNGYKSPLMSGQENFSFTPGDQFYSIDLTNRTISETTDSGGDFQFRLSRKKGANKWDRFDWAFDLRGQNGNTLKETDERYDEMLFGPEDSFTNSYKCLRSAADSSMEAIWQSPILYKIQQFA